MKRALCIAIWIFCITPYAAAEQVRLRVVHFPKDHAVGRLKVRDIDAEDNYIRGLISLPGWVLLGQAQGDINVPAGTHLRLEVYGDTTDISFLADLEPNDLQVLILSGVKIYDEDLIHLKGLSGLLGLNLGSTNIDGTGLVHLGSLTSLENLDFFNTQINDAELAHLLALKSLKYLGFLKTQINGSGLKHLKVLTSLVSLDLAMTAITDESLAHLAELTLLKELMLYDTNVTDKGLAHLKSLCSLEELVLGKLESRNGYSPITDKGLVHINELTALKYLYLYRTQITDTGLAHLDNLEMLEALLLKGTQITGEGLAFLKEVPALKYLGFEKTNIGHMGLANCRKWSDTLEGLRLEDTKISDADLAHLVGFKVLKNLDVSNTSITDAGLVHIKKLNSLESLNLDNTYITDDGLMSLKDLPNLQKIRIMKTGVTNVGLEKFKQISASNSVKINYRRLSISTKEKGLGFVEKELPQIMGKPPSLLGKLLPEPKDMNIEISSTDINDKMILVCFFDMNQRPSRYCIKQLATKANQLKQKDVIVVAVQASNVNENALNEWVKKYKIPFPVGIIQREPEKTRFNWGVKSLPWLILTDAEHIVRAEGFGLEELDEKLNEKAGVPLRPAKVSPVEDSPVSARSSRRPRKIPGKPLLRQTVRSASSKSSGRLIRVIGVARDENGKPVAGVEVRRLHGPGPVSTDARGMFELVWDPNRNKPLVDTYYIVARHEQHNLGVVVEVPEFEQDTKTVNMNLLPAVTFKGKVVEPAGGAIELARVDILLHTPTQGSGLYNTITDSEGRFEFNGIPAAHKYSFVAKASGYGSTWVHDIYVSRNLPQNRFELEPITLAIADESVSGVVVDANDKPISGARLSTDGKGQPQHYNIQTDAEGKFTIDEVCPGNLRIYATVSGEILLRGYARTHGGATDVRIVVTEVASPDKRRFVPKKPPSLVGKALPKLKDLGIELSSAEGSSKAILLCFFNIEQRPSRHCVTELAKRAEELKEKGIAVVAIQASKVDENTLNEWVKKNNIPFPFGMVQGDPEKTRFTWGVRSLPWLILTDSNHIIRAEGFTLTELDEKIKGTGGG